MKHSHIARPRLLLAGIAVAMPLALLAEPMQPQMPPGGPLSGMGGHPPACGRPFDGAMEPVPPFLRAARLDEVQRDKVFQIMHAQIPQLREQEKARAKARQALAELGLSGQYSEARAKTLADTLAKANAEIELIHARSDSQLVALLTPEQRAAVDKARKDADGLPPHHPHCSGPHG